MEYTTIGEACTLHARIGWQGLTKSEYLDEGDYYLVTGIDFDNGHIAFDTCHFVTKERYDQDQHIQLQLNDVLVTKDGTIGKVAFIDRPIDKPATLNSGVFVVRPKNPDLLLPEYLMIMLMSGHFSRFIEQIKVGCTIAHLNQEKFLRYQFPLPPVSEQKHIIEVYYSATEIIEKRQHQLRTLDTLIKARFVEMFGEPHRSKTYPYIKVSELTDVVSGGTPDRKNADYWNDGTVPWVKTTELQNNIIIEVEERISEKGLSESSAKIVPAGTVLIAMYGQGKTRGMTGFLGIKACTNQACACLLPTSDIDMQYLWHFLILSYDELRNLAQGGNQPNLNAGMIKNFPILVPPMEKQKQFVAFVSQVDKSKAVVQEALSEAQQLFDSLMQQYFG